MITSRPLRYLRFAVLALAPQSASAALPQAESGREARAVEMLRIDGHERDLVPVTRGLLLADATIVLAQDMDYSVRAFDMQGRERWKSGRRGQGPGEFATVSRLGVRGEEVWVADVRNSRISYLDGATGSLLRDHHFPTLAEGRVEGYGANNVSFAFVGPVAVYPDSSLMASLAAPSGGPSPDSVYFGRLDSTGRLLRLALAAGPEQKFFARGPNGTAVSRVFPFRHQSFQVTSSDGRYVAAAFAHLDSGSPAADLSVLDSEGQNVYEVRVPAEARRLGREDWATAREEAVARIPAALLASYLREAEDVAGGFAPFLTGLVVSDEGHAWVSIVEQAGRTKVVEVDDSGRMVRSSVLPADTRLLDARGDLLLAVREGGMGVPNVLLYRIEPAAVRDPPIPW